MRIRDLSMRRKLAITFVIVVLPLVAGQLLALHLLSRDLRESAELELTNIVGHLRRAAAADNLRAASGRGDRERVKDLVRSIHVGRTGYAFAMDSKGTLHVHPDLEGQNILDRKDSDGFAFIQAIAERARALGPEETGTIRYPWHVGDEAPRVKILKFEYFEPWDWIIAAGSYEDEIFGSLETLRIGALVVALLTLALVVVLTVAMTRLITGPLGQLTEMTARIRAGDLDHRVHLDTGDELSELASAFGAMADEVREKRGNLERLVRERTEQLREQREQYRCLVESTVDGIVTTDLHGTITFVNKGFESIVGASRAQAVGRKIWQFYEGGRELAHRIMDRLREDGAIDSFEMQFRGGDRVVPIRTSASILRDGEGRSIGTLGIFSDMTERRRLEADLARAQAELVQTMKLRALGDMVSGVAHEVNNPLMASTTILHVMRGRTCKEDCPNRGRLDLLQRCNDRIARIVDHLRDFSRESQMRREPLDVNVPVENALLITGQQLMDMQMEIRRDLMPSLPLVTGDSNQLEQVFLDIIANARDAMEASEQRVLSIRTAPAVTADGGSGVEVAISDKGPGIPEDVLPKIFEPFFTTKEAGKGTGLGLAISYGIIDKHGGTIEAVPAEGGGTTFRIVLPALCTSKEA